jgi:hypothetical protein
VSILRDYLCTATFFFGFIKKNRQVLYKIKNINVLLFDLIQLPSKLNVNRSKCYLHHLCYFIIHLFFFFIYQSTIHRHLQVQMNGFLAKLNTRVFFYYKNFIFFLKKILLHSVQFNSCNYHEKNLDLE